MSKNPLITRRRLVALGVGGLALVGLGAGYYAWRRSRFTNFEDELREFALAMADAADGVGVSISDEIVTRWVEDFEAFGGKPKLKRGRPSRRKLESLLMSTDLFDSESGGKVTRYVAHYNPHKNPCYNPMRVVNS
jgi:hypothetical protein